MSKIIVMMGSPGAGKGTQARLLAEKFGYPQISTGDILRQMAEAETPLGREIRETQAAGRLVSDAVLAELILARTLKPDCREGYVLDGFPRTLEQAHLLEDLAERQRKAIRVIKVVVPRAALLQRLTGRRTCTQCGEIYNIFLRLPQREGLCDLDGAPLAHRSDDKSETVSTRLEAYERSTAPLIEYYRQSGRLVEIDGERTVDEVFRELYATLNATCAH